LRVEIKVRVRMSGGAREEARQGNRWRWAWWAVLREL
jgi:hypothetical protein